MKRFFACALVTLAASNAQAVVINTAGEYTFDSVVDEIIVDSSLNTEDVMINVIAGGVVNGDIVCSGVSSPCDFRVTVSGNGNVMGRIRGPGAQINILDTAHVGFAGVQSNDGGRITVGGSANLGTLTGAGSGVVGRFEINGGFIDSVIAGPQLLILDMNGGIIDDNLSSWGMRLDMRGGDILGDVRSQDALMRFEMRGGHISGDLLGDEGMQGFIVGGSIDGDLRARVGGVFDISGGQFGTGSSLWSLGGAQIMNVHGRDLTLSGANLTGFLLDGSWLDVDVSFTPTFSGQLNLLNVPEPGTLAIFGVGLLGAFVARRKRIAGR